MDEKVIEVLDGKLKEYKDSLKGEVEALAKKNEAVTAEVNETMAKQGATLAEIQEKLTDVQKAQGHLSANLNKEEKNFEAEFVKALKDNHEAIQGVKKGNGFNMKLNTGFSTKAVGDMTISANLSGSAVATYDLTPAVRGRRKVHFRDLVQVVPSATGIFKFYRQNSTVGEGSFGVQTEGSAKAQIDYDNTEVTVTVDTIAGFSRISRQMLRDLPFMQSFLPAELQEDYYRSEDNKFINTLMAQCAAYSTTATVYAEKLIEWAAALMARDYNPNGFVTTAANWATLLSTKPADYSIPGGVTIDAMGNVAVAGIPVIILNGMTGTKTFVGDWSKAKIVQSNGLSIGFFEQDADNVTKNLVTVRAEADVALATLRTDAFLYV